MGEAQSQSLSSFSQESIFSQDNPAGGGGGLYRSRVAKRASLSGDREMEVTGQGEANPWNHTYSPLKIHIHLLFIAQISMENLPVPQAPLLGGGGAEMKGDRQ